MQIKICGLKYPDNIREVLRLKPNYIGLIFHPYSPRFVDEEISPGWMQELRGATKVGVFVNKPIQDLMNKADLFGLDMVQLHGLETPAECRLVRASGLPVIKAFSVGEQFDFQQIMPYEKVVDYFLFDTKGKQPGGNGTAFDWQILDNYPSEVPFFLSGGIGPEHAEALRSFSHPRLHALDLNSRFEVEPGLKDVERLKQFMEKVSVL
ncbi:MAG: phosphoribosylanthranilate isomerase [Bacteroidetes bacterium]|nr:MAG: phosphoribosylanthranilate isomerase [Bacteroidota bacterium]